MQNIKNTMLFLSIMIGISTQIVAQNNKLGIRVYDQNKILVPYVGFKISPITNTDNVKSTVLINYPHSISTEKGQYLIVLNKYGFQEYRDTVDISMENKKIDIFLLPLGFGLGGSNNISTQTKNIRGITTIISAKDIQNIGARNLIDILNTIPGFTIGSDIKNTVSIGIRGIWANNTRYLLMFNGVELNENIFGTAQLGSRISPDMIERIEINKGAGLVTNGEYGILGVINIITKKTPGKNNVEVAGSVGFTDSISSRRDFSMNLSIPLNKDMTLSINGAKTNTYRSDKIYKDNFGGTSNFGNKGQLKNDFFNLTLDYKSFVFSYFQENMEIESQDQVKRISSKQYTNNHKVQVMSATGFIRLNKRLTMRPRFFVKKSIAYNQLEVGALDRANGIEEYDVENIRTGIQNKLQYDFNQKINLQFGLLYHLDDAVNKNGLFNNNLDKLHIDKLSAHVLFNGLFGKIDKSYMMFNVGGRSILYDFTYKSFSPIASLSYHRKKFYIKSQFSYPVSMPTVNDINENIPLQKLETEGKRERARNIDFETGLVLNSNFNFGVNVFDYKINNPYTFWANQNSFAQANQSEIHTQGVEAFYKQTIAKFLGIDLNYSFYQSLGSDTVFKVSGTKANLALAQQKFYGGLNFDLKFINININSIWYVDAYQQTAGNRQATLIKQSPILNLVFLKSNIGNSGLKVNFAIMNILNTNNLLHQPYFGNHGSIPTLGREFYFKLSYTMSSKKKNVFKL